MNLNNLFLLHISVGGWRLYHQRTPRWEISLADLCRTSHQIYFLYSMENRGQHCSIQNCADEKYLKQNALKSYILQDTQHTFISQYREFLYILIKVFSVPETVNITVALSLEHDIFSLSISVGLYFNIYSIRSSFSKNKKH